MATELIPFRIGPAWKERLETLAESKGMARSHAVRVAVKEWIKNSYDEKEVIVEAPSGFLISVKYRLTPDNEVKIIEAEILS